MPLDLTTLAEVKAFLGGETTHSDAVITSLIKAVSQEAEQWLNRHVLTAARAEVYQVKPGQPVVWLRGFPIAASPAAVVKYSTTRDFTDAETLDTDVYDVLLDTGELVMRSLRCSPLGGFIQVTYTGGLSDTTPNFMTNLPRVANAAVMEVINRLNRSSNPSGSVQFAMSGGVQYQKQLQPLDDFYNALAPLRRVA